MQHSSTGNPDIIPEKEKKESARDHTERRSMWTPASENKHTAYHSFRGSVDDLILTAAVVLVFFPSTTNIIDPLSDNLACWSMANLWLTWWQWPRLQPVNILWLGKDPSVGHIDRPASRKGAAWRDWMVCEGYQLGTAAVCIRLSWGDGISGRARRDGRTDVVYIDNTGLAA